MHLLVESADPKIQVKIIKDAKKSVRNDRIAAKYFALPLENINFALQNLATRVKSLQTILHYRLTALTLLNLENLTSGVKMSLVKPVLYPLLEGTDGFTIFVTQGVFQNLARQMWEKLGRALLLYVLTFNNINIILLCRYLELQ